MEEKHETVFGQDDEEIREYPTTVRSYTREELEQILIDPEPIDRHKSASMNVNPVLAIVIILLVFVASGTAAVLGTDAVLSFLGLVMVIAPFPFSFSKKRSFHPTLVIPVAFFMGAGIFYRGVTMVVYQCNPFFDPYTFLEQSRMIFGLLLILFGVILFAYMLYRKSACSCEVSAVCTNAEHLGHINKRLGSGILSWEYEYEGQVFHKDESYTAASPPYREGQTKTICIDPAHPQRTRQKGFDITVPFAIVHVIIGLVYLCCL